LAGLWIFITVIAAVVVSITKPYKYFICNYINYTAVNINVLVS